MGILGPDPNSLMGLYQGLKKSFSGASIDIAQSQTAQNMMHNALQHMNQNALYQQQTWQGGSSAGVSFNPLIPAGHISYDEYLRNQVNHALNRPFTNLEWLDHRIQEISIHL